MKKLIISSMIAVMLLGSNAMADSGLTVELNGMQVSFDNKQPEIINGRTMIPLRGVFEQMGYSVDWDSKTKTATLKSAQSIIVVTANSSTFTVNGETKSLDVPAQIMEGSMMLPLRAIGESTGAQVNWDSETKTVKISGELSVEEVAEIIQYCDAYGKATIPISQYNNIETVFANLGSSEKVKPLCSEIITIVQGVKSDLNKLNPPKRMEKLHNGTIQLIDYIVEVFNLAIDCEDGKVTVESAYARLEQLDAELTQLMNELDEYMNEILVLLN